MNEQPKCPYASDADREAAKRRRGTDCCCCIKARFQPWHGKFCPHAFRGTP